MILFLIGPAIIHACDIIDTRHFLLIHAYVLLYYGVNVCVYVLWVFLPEINLLTYLPTTRMANGEEVRRSYDDTATENNRPPAGGKRWMIREGGSASRVSINARPRDPGGGTGSSVQAYGSEG